MIELKEVTKEYSKGIAALNGINLRIEQGEFVFVVGDSGSGKSTLIRLLMKEIEPTSGTIIVNGQNLNRMKHRQIPQYRRGIGVVFQDFRLLKDRNIYENIAFAQRVTENQPVSSKESAGGSVTCRTGTEVQSVPEGIVRWGTAESCNCQSCCK